MIKYKIYDENTKCEKMWIESSNIYFSKMIESPTENKGDLFITFKNGATYKYKDVNFEDYVLFVSGGIDFSQGKTLNKVIKPKYLCEKVEKGPTLSEINEEYDILIGNKIKEKS